MRPYGVEVAWRVWWALVALMVVLGALAVTLTLRKRG
jgi:hypothetical protein